MYTIINHYFQISNYNEILKTLLGFHLKYDHKQHRKLAIFLKICIFRFLDMTWLLGYTLNTLTAKDAKLICEKSYLYFICHIVFIHFINII